MPEVFELARDAGVDSRKLYDWSRIHINLYEEALRLADANGAIVDLGPDDLDCAKRVFRQEIQLPSSNEQR